MAAFFIANAVCFLYERPVGWIDTEEGASAAVNNPHSITIHGTEGYGINRIDSNGFFNPDIPIDDEYILVMGASHTTGRSVDNAERYTTLMNDKLKRRDDRLYVYNIGCDGHYLPAIIKHFDAAVTEFDGTKAIVIEIGSTDYSTEQFEESIVQVENDGVSTHDRFVGQSKVQKIKLKIKEYIPLISHVKKQLVTISSLKETAKETDNLYDSGYYNTASNALRTIRAEFDGPIVILYHPPVEISYEGNMNLAYSNSFKTFSKICAENDIDLIDMGPVFVENYDNNHELPYGFVNSTPGDGHLNRVGHRLVAEELIKYMEERK